VTLEYRILKDGELIPATELEWAVWLRDKPAQRVDRTTLETPGGSVTISTICLGIDHSFGEGPPLWFETMVMGGPLNQEMERYSTLEEARAGHQAMVERVKEEEANAGP
jgi:hypothetical protein